jgi:hypothetical protein
VLPINRAAFTVAHAEWKKLQLETRMHVGQMKDLECPGCVPGEVALHGDGNQKLFTWAPGGHGKQASREPYYQDVLFVSADLVGNDMKATGKILKNEVGACAACARVSAVHSKYVKFQVKNAQHFGFLNVQSSSHASLSATMAHACFWV